MLNVERDLADDVTEVGVKVHEFEKASHERICKTLQSMQQPHAKCRGRSGVWRNQPLILTKNCTLTLHSTYHSVASKIDNSVKFFTY